MKTINEENSVIGPVLVLDDEKNIVTVLVALLAKRGFLADGFTSPQEALRALREKDYVTVVTDLYMPELDGMVFMREVHKIKPELPVIMITAFGTVDSAVDAIKQGAFDYVTKPFEQSEICMVVQKALNTFQLRNLDVSRGEFSPLLQGAGMQKVRELVQKTASSPTTILILGEPGSGKDLLAEEIHRHSDRSTQPLIKFNCAAVSPGQMDVELFGGIKAGRLELANGGTLFLDEISQMPMECQVKFLAYLETGKFEPAAGNLLEQKNANIRLIAASNHDLQEQVRAGNFREDLYYKLNIVPIHLPPLRERREDMPQLVRFFLERLSRKLGKSVLSVDEECLRIFTSAVWPGNLRQLEQVLERMLLLAEGKTLRASDIQEDFKRELNVTGGENARFRDIIKKRTQDLEKDLIERALQEMDNNVTRTAELLGLSRKGLQLKMKELGIK